MTENENFKMATVEEAIADFKQGKFVIVVDDPGRENEGDLITSAEMITEEKVNFMLKNGRGALCANNHITLQRAWFATSGREQHKSSWYSVHRSG